jgi:hypothetical protein
MIALVLLVLLVAVGVASVLGLAADTRDPEYGVGPLLVPRRSHVDRAEPAARSQEAGGAATDTVNHGIAA